MKYHITLSILLSVVFASNILKGQDLVFEFTNPAFGGNNFNYSWMLTSAQAQDTTTDPDAEDFDFDDFDRFDSSSLEGFERSLNSRIISQLSTELFDEQFGENGLEEGIYQVGSFQIEVSPGAEGISVIILDTSTGDQTSVLVPFF